MFEILQEGEVVLRKGIGSEALQKIKILWMVSFCTIKVVYAESEDESEVRLCCGCFLSKPRSSCRSRAKMFHHDREKGRDGCAYLLLGPR
jgi:hypothetical protein